MLECQTSNIGVPENQHGMYILTVPIRSVQVPEFQTTVAASFEVCISIDIDLPLSLSISLLADCFFFNQTVYEGDMGFRERGLGLV